MRLAVLFLGAVGTVFIWIVHLRYPSLLESAPEVLRTLAALLVLAAPFLTVLSAAYSLFPDGPIEAAHGPMSTYLQGERQRKRWKIMVLAGMVTAINLFGMAIAKWQLILQRQCMQSQLVPLYWAGIAGSRAAQHNVAAAKPRATLVRTRRGILARLAAEC